MSENLQTHRVLSRQFLSLMLAPLVADSAAVEEFLDNSPHIDPLSDGLVSVRTYALMEDLGEWIGDPAWGLRAAEEFPYEKLALVWNLYKSSPNIRQAVSNLDRMIGLVCSEFGLQLDENDEQAQFSVRTGVIPHPQASEFIVALATRLNRALFDGGRIDAVLFQHPAPADPSRLQAFFDCPVLFGQNVNGILFPTEYLDAPFPTANEELRELLERCAQRMLKRRANESRNDVVQAYKNAVTRGETDLGAIAKHLGLSSRGLQRQLRDSRTSHRELLDRVRAQYASSLLTIGKDNLAVTAERLGFSEPASFARAFRRWTGMTPGEYRARYSIKQR